MLLLVFIPSYCYHKRSEQERSVCNNYWDGPRWEPKEKARPHTGEGRVFGASCDGMRLSLSRAQWERKNHLQWHIYKHNIPIPNPSTAAAPSSAPIELPEKQKTWWTQRIKSPAHSPYVLLYHSTLLAMPLCEIRIFNHDIKATGTRFYDLMPRLFPKRKCSA